MRIRFKKRQKTYMHSFHCNHLEHLPNSPDFSLKIKIVLTIPTRQVQSNHFLSNSLKKWRNRCFLITLHYQKTWKKHWMPVQTELFLLLCSQCSNSLHLLVQLSATRAPVKGLVHPSQPVINVKKASTQHTTLGKIWRKAFDPFLTFIQIDYYILLRGFKKPSLCNHN